MVRALSFLFLTLLFGTTGMGVTSVTNAQAAQLEVSPSSTEISADENISIQFTLSSDGSISERLKPIYSAPDFDEVNVYAAATGVESSFINGTLSVRHTQTVVVVLHPKKTGPLKISGIKVKSGSVFISAPDLVIDVRDGGGPARPLPRGQGGLQMHQRPGTNALPGTGVQTGGNGRNIFVRAEPSKLKAYKGEQIILTYALYTRVQLVGMAIERYPNVPGFLKEDIDVPAATNRLSFNRTVVNGQEYERAVLAQYAIYPVKEGNLPIDPFTGKFSYRSRRAPRGVDDDEDDPFNVQNFFQAMQTVTAQATSDRVNVEVLPLPGEGQPKSFAGLVGDFQVNGSVDKYTVKMGEPVNFKVKIEGSGHAGSMERLNTNFPQDFELYEDKSSASFNKGGTSQRTFDFMLIPKARGKFQLPAIEVSMFNPETRRYITRSTQPISIEVLEGTLGQTYNPKAPTANPTANASKEDIRYWMSKQPEGSSPVWDWLGRSLASASFGFLLLQIGMLARGGRREAVVVSASKLAKEILNEAKGMRASDGTPLAQRAQRIEALLHRSLETLGIDAGSLTRPEIAAMLLEKGIEPSIVTSIEEILSECEKIRYAPQAFGQEFQGKAGQLVANNLSEILQKILRV